MTILQKYTCVQLYKYQNPYILLEDVDTELLSTSCHVFGTEGIFRMIINKDSFSNSDFKIKNIVWSKPEMAISELGTIYKNQIYTSVAYTDLDTIVIENNLITDIRMFKYRHKDHYLIEVYNLNKNIKYITILNHALKTMKLLK